MLILDKKKDIAILQFLGASPVMIRRIFFTEGLLISFMGESRRRASSGTPRTARSAAWRSASCPRP
jgi:hypothetical protein